MSDRTGLIQDIDSYIGDALQAWGVPGAAVAIVKDDELLLSKGYGIKEVGRDDPVDEATLFAIGSCTKAFTAAAVGLLVDEDRLDWDDRIVQYLPGFELYDPWITQEATIRDVLTHRVGYMRTQRLMYKDPVFDPDDNIRRMKYMRPVAPFRTKCCYNNPGYVVAGKIVEVVSGQTWDRFVEERLFGPLGMRSSSPTWAAHQAKGQKNSASFHLAEQLDHGFKPSILRAFEPVQPSPPTNFGKHPAGSIVSNLPDLLAWAKMLLDQGMHQGQQILSPSVVSELISPQIVVRLDQDQEVGPIFSMIGSVDVLSYGLGWYVFVRNGRLTVVHGGDAVGQSSMLMFIPEDRLIVAVLLNTLTWVFPFLGVYIVDALLSRPTDYCGEALGTFKGIQQQAAAGIQQVIDARAEESSPSLELDAYAGRYASDLFGEIEISVRDGQMVHRYGSSGKYDAELAYWEYDTFLANYHNRHSEPEFVTFLIGEDGGVSALEIRSLDLFVDKFLRLS